MTDKLRLFWHNNMLSITSKNPLPGGGLEVCYLEAFCRSGSTDKDWNKTVILHDTELISNNKNNDKIVLKSRLTDGVEVMHVITSTENDVDFRLEIHNTTDVESHAHWAQPCIRVGAFTGMDKHPNTYQYIKRCFIFLDGEPVRMPMKEWATDGRYTPGQVWRNLSVPYTDVNPRPISPFFPSNGLIGCFSADDKMLLATAWEPYQELFQGVIQCIHSDFRIGGVNPYETKRVRGKIYLMDNNFEELTKRYKDDFPEHIGSYIK